MEPIVRRAIVDLLFDVGGEQTDQELAMVLVSLSHRVTRRDVAGCLLWLAQKQLVRIEELGSFLVARILEDGRELSQGRLQIDGVSRFRTGD
jgi:hypothetical protein